MAAQLHHYPFFSHCVCTLLQACSLEGKAGSSKARQSTSFHKEILQKTHNGKTTFYL